MRPWLGFLGSTILVGAAVAVCSCGSSGAAPGGQTPDEGRSVQVEDPAAPPDANSPQPPIVDEDFRFRLDWPGSGWTLLREPEAVARADGAVAGMISEDGVVGFVIPENAPGAELQTYAESVVDVMPLEGKSVRLEDTEFCGFPAVRIEVEGAANGVPVRYELLVWLNGDYAFQLIAGGAAELVGEHGESFGPVFEAFSLLPGEVAHRSTGRPAADSTGVGWRIRDGIFESAIDGIAISPPDGWRLVVGSELQRMNAGASIGLARENPDIRAIVLGERAPASGRDGFAEGILADGAADMNGERTGEAISARIGDQDIVLARSRIAAPFPMDLLHGVVFVGDRCLQLLVWFPAVYRERGEASARELAAAIVLLPTDRVDELARQLRDAADIESRVGATYALRRGRYVDFADGYTWTQPGGFWRIRVGAEARATNPSASVYFEEPSLGLYGLIITEPARTFDTHGYHAAVVGNMWDSETLEAAGDPVPVRLGAAEGLLTVADRHLDGMDLHYWVATAVFHGCALQIVVWGLPGNKEAAEDRVNDVLSGLEFAAARLQIVTTAGGAYADHRLGFSFRPPSGEWTVTDLTPASVTEFGAVVAWQREDWEIVVVAVGANGREAHFMEAMVERLGGPGAADGSDAGVGWQSGTLAGRPATVARWSSQSGRFAAFGIVRDGVSYGVIVRGPGAPDSQTLDPLAAGFDFLD